MKKKTITFFLVALLAVGAIVPLAVYASETFNYGYDQVNMQNYSDYFNTSYPHSSGMIKRDINYKASVVSPGYWSRLRLDYTGPYVVTYQKYIGY
jgi:hypothetical protein